MYMTVSNYPPVGSHIPFSGRIFSLKKWSYRIGYNAVFFVCFFTFSLCLGGKTYMTVSNYPPVGSHILF